MENADLMGYAAGLLITISLLPQVIKSYRTKSTKDISLARYAFYISGLSLWILYALSIGSMPLFLMSLFEALLAFCVLGMKLRYG